MDIDGLNDMSRVRVDIGRGEGGVVPTEDGSFFFDDLEPDEYKLTVTYVGGLTPAASKSAYVGYEKTVLALQGGNVNVGDVVLSLATGTVQGEVQTSDGSSAQGAEVSLVDATGVVRSAQVRDGLYILEKIPVGYHQLQAKKDGYASAASQSACRPAVQLEEADALVTPPPIVLAQTTPSFSPGFNETSEVVGATWVLAGENVTLLVNAAFATEIRIWQNSQESPEWRAFQSEGHLIAQVPAGRTMVHVQLRNACGFESAVYDLEFIRDAAPPTITELRGPNRPQDDEGRIWLTESAANVSVVVGAVDDLSGVVGFATYHAADNGLGTPNDLVFEEVNSTGGAGALVLPVALSAGEGEKVIAVYAKDRAGNISSPAKLRFMVDATAPSIAYFGLVSGDTRATETSPTFSLEVNDGSGVSQMQTSLSGAFTGSPVPYQNRFSMSLVPPEEDGARVVYVRVWDAAGNVSTASTTVNLLTRGSVMGQVQLEGGGDASALEVLVIGTSTTQSLRADGSFQLNNVPAGAQIIRIRSSDSASVGISLTDFAVVVVPGEVYDLGRIQLRRTRGAIGGRVIDEDGAPIGGVLVEVVGSNRNALSDSAGDYLIEEIPTGNYTLRFSLAAYSSVDIPSILVERDMTTTVPVQTLHLIRGAMVGTALRDDAEALGLDHNGIEVTVFGNGNNVSAFTDAGGAFRVEGLKPGFYNVEAKADAYLPREKNGIYLAGGVENEAGVFRLERRKGLLSGTVTAEGGVIPVGALVSIFGTGYRAELDGAGRYEMRVPVGNYDGVRVAYEYFQDDTYDETVTVTENGTFTVPALHLLGASGRLAGTVTLAESAAGTHGDITIQLTGKPGSRAYGTTLVATTDTNGNFAFGADPATYVISEAPDSYLSETGGFVFTGIPNGRWTMKLEPTATERAAGRETAIGEVEVVAGQETVSVVELRNLYLLIDDDAENTNSENVNLSFGATGCATVRVALENEDFENAQSHPCNRRLESFDLGEQQGEREVFARYYDADGNRLGDASDTIWLDSRASILSVEHGVPVGTKVGYGQRLNIVVQTEEAGGYVEVSIAGYESNIALEEGGDGCSVGETGCYGIIYDVLKRIDVVAATVSATFTDIYENEATAIGSPLTIGIPPLITDLEIEPDLGLENAIIRFTTDERSTGQVFIGQAANDLCIEGVCPAETQNELNHEQTVNGLHAGESTASLERNKRYFVQVRATDAQGNAAYSSVRDFFLRPDPPSRVVAFPGINRAHVRWEAPPQLDLMGYRVERSDDGGATWSILAGPDCTTTTMGAYNHEALLYEDKSASAGGTYRYRVTALDEYCNASDWVESLDVTPAAGNTGPTAIPQGALMNLVWTEIGSPYLIEGNIAVDPNDTLVIGPGADIDLAAGAQIVVRGHIAVLGGRGTVFEVQSNGLLLENDANAVRFSSTDEWGGLKLSNNSMPPLGARGYRWGDLLYRATFERCREPCVDAEGHIQLMRSVVRSNEGVSGWAYTEDVVAKAAALYGSKLYYALSVDGVVSLLDSNEGNHITNTRAGQYLSNGVYRGYWDSNVCPDFAAGCSNFFARVYGSTLNGWANRGIYFSQVNPRNALAQSVDGNGCFSSDIVGPSVTFGKMYYGPVGVPPLRGVRLPAKVTTFATSGDQFAQSYFQTLNCALESEIKIGFPYEYGTLSVDTVYSDCSDSHSFPPDRVFDYNDDVTRGYLASSIPVSAYPRIFVRGPGLVQQQALVQGIDLQASAVDLEDGVLPLGKVEWKTNQGVAIGNDSRLTLPATLGARSNDYEYIVHGTDSHGQTGTLPWKVRVINEPQLERDYMLPDSRRWRVAKLRLLEVPPHNDAPDAASFVWTCDALSCTTRCTFDNETQRECRSPLELSALSQGEHRLTIQPFVNNEPIDLPQIFAWTVGGSLHTVPSYRVVDAPDSSKAVQVFRAWDGASVLTCSTDGLKEELCGVNGNTVVFDEMSGITNLTIRSRDINTAMEIFPPRHVTLQSQDDQDGDGWPDEVDPCPYGAEIGQYCNDHDRDGVPTPDDACPFGDAEHNISAIGPLTNDADGDGCEDV